MEISTKEAKNTVLAYEKKNGRRIEKAAFFYSKDVLNKQLQLLASSFPKNTLHAIAIKTMNHPLVLEHIVSAGFGLEAASIEEVKLAQKAGIANEKIVFDSPVKTKEEILYCHKNIPGMLLNINCLEELDRYPENFSAKMGLRVNPLVSNGGGKFFNVSHSSSKFGVPISKKEEILTACLTYENITCIHMHIGSNLNNFDANIIAISKVKTLADEINEARKGKGISTKIDTIDIGGGIMFDQTSENFKVQDFAKALSTIEDLTNQYQLITEYGNFVHKHTSFAVSNIEYVIDNGNEVPQIAYLHLGADLFVRKVYSNLNIDYPIEVIRKTEKDNSNQQVYNFVGPLCFSGDILFENIKLPTLYPDDQLLIMNCGSNTLSMWSSHCSRELPPFIMY